VPCRTRRAAAASACRPAQPAAGEIGWPELVATGARAEQIQLRLFDAVLGLAALAVQLVIECRGLTIDIGHHKRGLLPWGPYSSRVITRRSISQLWRIAELADLALLEPAGA